MSKAYGISQLIMNNETPYSEYNEELGELNKVKKVYNGNDIRYLTIVEARDIESITTPEGRELTLEELFDFVIGNDTTDLTRTKNRHEKTADIAIVLGNVELSVTRERAIKAFELYKQGLVKKIIFTGGIKKARDKKRIMNPESIESYMSNEEVDMEWQDLTEADWGAETFIRDIFHENFKDQSSIITEEFLRNIGVNPEDVLIEGMSTTTQENAEFCKNIFDEEEIEKGTQIRKAIIVTTCTHGNRAMRQFKKVFRDKVSFTWCPSTLDLEKHESLKNILDASSFDETAFKQELKKTYCTDPELKKMLMVETAINRNVFVLGYIDEPYITVTDREVADGYDDFSR